MVSTSSASQSTLDLAPLEPSPISIRPRYEVRPPPRATDLETMLEEVFGAMWTILAPASWCWPAWSMWIDCVEPLACWRIRLGDGYFIVTMELMLPSTHSMVATS